MEILLFVLVVLLAFGWLVARSRRAGNGSGDGVHGGDSGSGCDSSDGGSCGDGGGGGD